MNKTQEALRLAIDALDTLMMEKGSIYQQALIACKEALAELSIPNQLPIPTIAKGRDEIYYAWRKHWAWGIPSKDGEAVFNANADGFQAGWLACEKWIKEKQNETS